MHNTNDTDAVISRAASLLSMRRKNKRGGNGGHLPSAESKAKMKTAQAARRAREKQAREEVNQDEPD